MTQDPRRACALDVADKAERVRRFQEATVRSALQIMASMGVTDPTELRPNMLRRRVNPTTVVPGEQLYGLLEPGQLLAEPPPDWAADWAAADPDHFAV